MLYSCVFTWVFICMCRSEVAQNHSLLLSSLFFKEGLSRNLEHIILTRLTVLPAPGSPLSQPHHTPNKHGVTGLCFQTQQLEIQTQVLTLAQQTLYTLDSLNHLPRGLWDDDNKKHKQSHDIFPKSQPTLLSCSGTPPQGPLKKKKKTQAGVIP